MQKKMLLLVLFTSPLFTANNETQNTENNKTENFYQCNDKLTALLEKQIALQTKSYELQTLQLELKLKEKEEQEKIYVAAFQAEANKPWYQKTWDVLAPSIQNAILRLIIASITGKIINSSISMLDHATGDLLVQNGYEKFAFYAGTFIVEESITGYLQTRESKKTLAHPEVQNSLAMLKNIRNEYRTDITKGEISFQVLDLCKKAQAGKASDEYVKGSAASEQNQNKEESFVKEELASTSMISYSNRFSVLQQSNQKNSKNKIDSDVVIEDITSEEDFYKQ